MHQKIIDNIKNYYTYVSDKSANITSKKKYRDYEKKIFTEELQNNVRDIQDDYRKTLITTMILARYFYLKNTDQQGTSPDYYARSKLLQALLSGLGWTEANTLVSFCYVKPYFKGLRNGNEDAEWELVRYYGKLPDLLQDIVKKKNNIL